MRKYAIEIQIRDETHESAKYSAVVRLPDGSSEVLFPQSNLFSCMNAAHKFIQKSERKHADEKHHAEVAKITKRMAKRQAAVINEALKKW